MAKRTGITKQAAVEKALADKGMDAKPVDLKPYIKEKYGLDMTTAHITTCKSKAIHAKKGPAAKKKPGPKPKAKVPPAAVSRPANNRSGISIDDLHALKGLIGRVGADHLRTLIGLFS
jgi:hypothetical protein